MKFRYKILEYRRQQERLAAYLNDHGTEVLTLCQILKLSAEITRLQMRIERIERMPYSQVEQDSRDWTEVKQSKLNKIGSYKNKTYNFQTKKRNKNAGVNVVSAYKY